jgi:hypothetical protein
MDSKRECTLVHALLNEKLFCITLLLLLLLLLTAIESSLCGRSLYTSTDETNKNKHT